MDNLIINSRQDGNVPFNPGHMLDGGYDHRVEVISPEAALLRCIPGYAVFLGLDEE